MAVGDGKGKKKKGNKRASNTRRHDRKYGRTRGIPQAGKCGSSFCTTHTGCQPWK